MANTMDKLREIAGSIRNFADVAEHCDITRICNTIPAMRVLADELDAILRESEAQGDAGAVGEPVHVGGSGFDSRAGGFAEIVIDGKRYDAQHVARVFLAASATPRTEPAEGREAVAQVAKCAGIGDRSIFLWTYPGGLHGFLGDHPVGTKLYAAPPAGSARLNDPELQAQLEDSVERHRRVVDALTGDGARVTVQAHEPTMFGPNDAWDPADAARVTDWIVGDGLGGIKAEAHFLTTHDDDRVKRAGTRLLERADKIITALAAREGGAS